MAQELLNLLTIEANQVQWDADLETNTQKLVWALRTWNISVSFAGDVSTPSVVSIQLQTANGGNLSEIVYLRVRICDNLLLSPATNATIAPTAGSPEEIITADKDIVVLTDSGGFVQITVTDATAEAMTLRIGPAPIQPVFANYNNSVDLTHS